jgi:hypothetical protein
VDLWKLLQGAVKGVLVFVGLVATIDVSFAPAVVERRSGTECLLAVRLQDAVTPEIEAMIGHSTLAVISYSVTLFTERDTKIVMGIDKTIQYRSIDGTYTVSSDARTVATASREEAVREVTAASFLFDPSGVRFGVAKASLDIPDVRDKNAVRSLWGDRAPTIVFDLASEK